MEVILLQKIENLGDLGEKVKVKPGYARNHLIQNRWQSMQPKKT